jgi:hypothetical protein
VGVDETGHADHAAPLDRLGAGCREPRSDRDDRAVAHVHVAARKVAERRIHGEHVGAAHHELAERRPRRAADGRLPGGLPLRHGGRRKRAAAPSAVAPAKTVRRLMRCLRMMTLPTCC